MRETQELVFGPVYSRRLGLSLGINNIPYKTCSYTCIYCQLGRTIKLTVERKPYSNPREVLEAVSAKLAQTPSIDYATFVPDGEPTLDTMLGEDIELLKNELGIKTAVITNASLLWIEEVRDNLAQADTVSIKIDAGNPETWRKINRPHPSLEFTKILEGIILFRDEYRGRLITETMLVEDVNNSPQNLEEIARIIAETKPAKAYIAIPVRPPAEPWVKPASTRTLVALYTMLKDKNIEAEILSKPEPPPPPPLQENPVEHIAAILAVHPLRKTIVEKMLEERSLDVEESIRELIEKHCITEAVFEGEVFLVKNPAKCRSQNIRELSKSRSKSRGA